jgi:gas vesicle protein
MNKNQILSFAVGLLGGALVGTATVVLVTPQSGAQIRQSIADKVNEILDAGKQAMAERRQELGAEYQARIEIPLTPE